MDKISPFRACPVWSQKCFNFTIRVAHRKVKVKTELYLKKSLCAPKKKCIFTRTGLCLLNLRKKEAPLDETSKLEYS